MTSHRPLDGSTRHGSHVPASTYEVAAEAPTSRATVADLVTQLNQAAHSAMSAELAYAAKSQAGYARHSGHAVSGLLSAAGKIRRIPGAFTRHAMAVELVSQAAEEASALRHAPLSGHGEKAAELAISAAEALLGTLEGGASDIGSATGPFTGGYRDLAGIYSRANGALLAVSSIADDVSYPATVRLAWIAERMAQEPILTDPSPAARSVRSLARLLWERRAARISARYASALQGDRS